MPRPIIEVRDISKSYTIGKRESYGSLRDEIMQAFSSPFRRKEAAEDDTVWALRDVSFDVEEGEVMGIIGRNGAGKSTLLKILSRITEPTRGKITMRGRVASLLEVGTGFHPELTGRENIFLNGALLGMTSREIKAKFDEIVAFSEIEKFLDTPVKRYSSGMYVRLAFAVAAHLEPEILIVDEVLAVGDAEFQKKCLGKMGDVAKSGRTVLFVSHNMAAVRNLCKRAILIKSGTLVSDGLVSEVTEKYLQGNAPMMVASDIDNFIKGLPEDPSFQLLNVKIRQNGKAAETVLSGFPLEIEIYYRLLERVKGFRVFFDLCDMEETILFRSFHDEDADQMPIMNPGSYVSKATIPAHMLGPVGYALSIHAGIFNTRYCLPASGIRIPLNVESSGDFNRAYLAGKFQGKLALHIPWTIEQEKFNDDCIE